MADLACARPGVSCAVQLLAFRTRLLRQRSATGKEELMHIYAPFTDRDVSSEARTVLRLLVIAGFFMSFGYNAWTVMFNNFAVDILHLNAEQVGLIQGLREIPGFLGFVMGLIVMVIPEMRIAGMCVALLGGGLVLMGGVHDFVGLLAATMIMSIGFHFFDSANQSLALTYVRKARAPQVLGALSSIGAFATVAGTLAVLALAGPLGYRGMIYLLGAVTLVGGLVVSILGRQSGAERTPRKVIFRSRYWLYYLLTFLLGIRRHIFSTFAILLLVQVKHVTVQQVAILSLANAVMTSLTYPQIGRLVSHFGERTILLVDFVLLALIFVGYACISWLPALLAFYIADNILFGFELALRTYFQKIAVSQQEITANVSMGQTINHLAAVFVPALGGWVWVRYGYPATFMVGIAVVLVGLVLSFWVRTQPAPAVQH